MSIHRRMAAKGVRWDVRLRRPDGRGYSRTFRTRAEAERFQATELADRARGSWLDPAAGQTLVAVWADEWYRSSVHTWRSRTAAAHRLALDRHWLPRFGHVRVSEMAPRQIQRAINELADQYQPTTIRTYYATLRALMSDAVDADVIGRTPCRGIKLPALRSDEKRVITPAELHRLADAIGERWRVAVYLGGVMGLRFGEVIALRRVDFDLAVAELTITRTITETSGQLEIGPPKTKASRRTLVMPTPLADEVMAHIERYAVPPTGLLFGDRNGGPVRRSNFARRVFIPAVADAGLDGLTFHGLRHSAATQWVADGIDVRTVQHRLGHSDPRLVLRLYAHASTEADRLAATISSGSIWGTDDGDG